MKKTFLSIFCLITLQISINSCKEDENNVQRIPDDETPTSFSLDISSCIKEVSPQTLDVVTWNVKNFPLTDSLTIDAAMNIINDLDADIIALQEIDDEASFEKLKNKLSGWSGTFFNQTSIDLGFLFKSSEITPVGGISPLYTDDSYAFPRAPIMMTFRHQNSIEFKLINIHLKCCNNGQERRREASSLLKSYIDENLAEENVIVLGDFNDEIVEINPEDNVFKNFIDDSANYRFATLPIAQGASSGWSYPSYPSHIDQILITNELFGRLQSTSTLTFDVCDDLYTDLVSDHRPVMARFSTQ